MTVLSMWPAVLPVTARAQEARLRFQTNCPGFISVLSWRQVPFKRVRRTNDAAGRIGLRRNNGRGHPSSIHLSITIILTKYANRVKKRGSKKEVRVSVASGTRSWRLTGEQVGPGGRCCSAGHKTDGMPHNRPTPERQRSSEKRVSFPLRRLGNPSTCITRSDPPSR